MAAAMRFCEQAGAGKISGRRSLANPDGDTYLLEVRSVRALETGPHASRAKASLSNVPYPVDHGVEYKAVGRLAEAKTGTRAGE